MSYPEAPWKLEGKAIQTLQLVDIKQAQKFVPKELEIVSIIPGKTLGAIYVSNYSSGSILEYNELIIVAAFVKAGGKVGGWIPYIYVDDLDSKQGGREIWGYPKEMATFTWTNNSVTVKQEEKILCNINYQKDWFSFPTWWRQDLTNDSITFLDDKILFSSVNLQAKIEVLASKVEIPFDSSFTGLNLDNPWITLSFDGLKLNAGKPEIIANKFAKLVA